VATRIRRCHWVGVYADGEEGDERVVIQEGGDEEGRGVGVRADGLQANGENGTRRLTGRQRRRDTGKVKEFSTMKDAESDGGDIASIQKSRRGRGTPKDMSFPARVVLLGFDAFMTYVEGNIGLATMQTQSYEWASVTCKRVHAGTLFHTFLSLRKFPPCSSLCTDGPSLQKRNTWSKNHDRGCSK